MKFLKGFLITLCVLIIFMLIGAYVVIKNFEINQYRSQITAEISKLVGRTVAIDKLALNVSLFKGVYAEVQGLTISEDSAFGEGDFLKIGSVQVGVDVLAFLSRREIVVTQVKVTGLDVVVIRDGQGVLNVQKIGSAADPASLQNAAPADPPPADAPPAMAIPSFSVDKIIIENGKLVFSDQGLNPPMTIAVSKIDFTVKGFSLEKAFEFAGDLAVLGQEKNISFSGKASVHLATQEANLNAVEVQLDLAKLKNEDVWKAVPQAKAAELTDQMQGHILIRIPSLSAGAQGLGDLIVNGQMRNGRIKTKYLPVPLDQITADFNIDANDVILSAYSVMISTGKISGDAKISEYMKTMGVNAQVHVQALPVGSLIGELPEGMKLLGVAQAQISVSGSNLANPDLLMSSLQGSGQFEVIDGKIENLNILKMVLKRITFLPGLAETVEAHVPEKYRKDFAKEQTIFQKVGSSVQIGQGAVNFPDLHIVSDLFEANMQIVSDFNLVGKVSGEIKLPADLSASMVSAVNTLNYLENPDGQIAISLTSFEGLLTKLKILPDVKELGKAALQGEGKRQINKLLNKVLNADDAAAPAEDNGPANDGEKIIGGVLDKLFK